MQVFLITALYIANQINSYIFEKNLHPGQVNVVKK